MKILLNNPPMYVDINPNNFFFTIQLLLLVSLNYGVTPGLHWGHLQCTSKPLSCSDGAYCLLSLVIRDNCGYMTLFRNC